MFLEGEATVQRRKESLMNRKHIHLRLDIPLPGGLRWEALAGFVRSWLPTCGNVLFTALVVGGLL
jgi:hypothetical protein